MNKLPIVEGLARRAISLGEMMGDTKGTDAMVARLLLATLPVLEASYVAVTQNNDVAAANLQQRLLEFDTSVVEIIREHQ